MIDLLNISARLDADEKLELTYRYPISTGGGSVTYESRTAQLLDVAVESGMFYVRQDGEIIWVKAEEVIEVLPESHA